MEKPCKLSRIMPKTILFSHFEHAILNVKSETGRFYRTKEGEVERMKRRSLALVLALLLAAALLQTSNAAEEALSGPCGEAGENLIWQFDPASGTLTVSGSGAMQDFQDAPPWASYTGQIQAISLPDGLTKLGARAFSDCTALSSAVLPERLRSIGANAFSGCACLESVSLPGGLLRMDAMAFQGCSRLSAIQLPDSLLALGEGAFQGCSALTSVQIPGCMEEISPYAFSGCTGLTSVLLPSSLKLIGQHAFEDCTALNAVTLPKSVTTVQRCAFRNCAGLRRIVLRNAACMVETGVFGGSDSGEDLNQPGSADSGEDLDLGALAPFTLGAASRTLLYGLHDPAFENTETQSDPLLGYEYRFPESYARTFGYRFYATNVFSDVKTGKYYELPVAWAYGNGVTSGTDAAHFSPNQTCTRAQVVTFLWSALKKPTPDSQNAPFVDVKKSAYYYQAVLWAYQKGVTRGVDATHFGPKQPCTRAQVVTFLWSALGKPTPTIESCAFVDAKPKDYFYRAMLWAVENGITSGIDAKHFGPNRPCTRAQVVTFLFQALEGTELPG